MSLWDKIKEVLIKNRGTFQVRNPLLFFTFCIALIGYELDRAIANLEQTGFYGLFTIATLAFLFVTVVRIVGKLTEKNPAHLYDDIELLKETLNAPETLKGIVCEFDSRLDDDSFVKKTEDKSPPKPHRIDLKLVRNRQRDPLPNEKTE